SCCLEAQAVRAKSEKASSAMTGPERRFVDIPGSRGLFGSGAKVRAGRSGVESAARVVPIRVSRHTSPVARSALGSDRDAEFRLTRRRGERGVVGLRSSWIRAVLARIHVHVECGFCR